MRNANVHPIFAQILDDFAKAFNLATPPSAPPCHHEWLRPDNGVTECAKCGKTHVVDDELPSLLRRQAS